MQSNTFLQKHLWRADSKTLIASGISDKILSQKDTQASFFVAIFKFR